MNIIINDEFFFTGTGDEGINVKMTIATQSVRRPAATQPHPSASPSPISATPATQSDSPCEKVPRLPRQVTVHVTKCHACHAKCAICV